MVSVLLDRERGDRDGGGGGGGSIANDRCFAWRVKERAQLRFKPYLSSLKAWINGLVADVSVRPPESASAGASHLSGLKAT